jgi:hypothetical protein
MISTTESLLTFASLDYLSGFRNPDWPEISAIGVRALRAAIGSGFKLGLKRTYLEVSHLYYNRGRCVGDLSTRREAHYKFSRNIEPRTSSASERDTQTRITFDVSSRIARDNKEATKRDGSLRP